MPSSAREMAITGTTLADLATRRVAKSTCASEALVHHMALKTTSASTP